MIHFKGIVSLLLTLMQMSSNTYSTFVFHVSVENSLLGIRLNILKIVINTHDGTSISTFIFNPTWYEVNNYLVNCFKFPTLSYFRQFRCCLYSYLSLPYSAGCNLLYQKCNDQNNKVFVTHLCLSSYTCRIVQLYSIIIIFLHFHLKMLLKNSLWGCHLEMFSYRHPCQLPENYSRIWKRTAQNLALRLWYVHYIQA